MRLGWGLGSFRFACVFSVGERGRFFRYYVGIIRFRFYRRFGDVLFSDYFAFLVG